MADQRALVKRWTDVSRYIYNRTVEYLREPGTKANWKEIKTGILSDLPDFCKEAPYQVKSIAVRDACIAVREAKKTFRETRQFRDVGFRSRKNPVQSCFIPKSAVKSKGVYHTILGELRYAERLPDRHKDCRLVSAYGATYLAVSYEEPRRAAENQGRVVALDPGIRNFLAHYSEDSAGWIGRHDIGRIQRLCAHLDSLISRTSQAPCRKRRNMRKAGDRMRRRVRNLVDELHHKAARWLVDNYDVILLPTFETSEMVVKGTRKLRSKAVRQMLTFAHYRFKTFLKHKAFETGKVVLEVNEAYTSKTVSWTGEVVHNLGSRRTIRGSDGRRMDRDLNGARGILLRGFGRYPHA